MKPDLSSKFSIMKVEPEVFLHNTSAELKDYESPPARQQKTISVPTEFSFSRQGHICKAEGCMHTDFRYPAPSIAFAKLFKL